MHMSFPIIYVFFPVCIVSNCIEMLFVKSFHHILSYLNMLVTNQERFRQYMFQKGI